MKKTTGTSKVTLAKSTIFHEICPLKEEDFLYVISRRKSQFDFPVHTHNVFELNFIEGAEGAVRFIGDSAEEISDLELVLVANTSLAHGWLDGNLLKNKTAAGSVEDVKEITIQFRPDVFPSNLLAKNQFKSVGKMFDKAACGISFSREKILSVKPLLDSLVNESRGFYMVTTFMNILYELSEDEDMRVLSSIADMKSFGGGQPERMTRIFDFVERNYPHQFKLKDVADAACMSEAALSRFFKQNTGMLLSEYITGVRISKFCRELINTDKSIAEICYRTGFNNISNFNRQFKRIKGCTPKEYRDFYFKKKILI